MKRLGLGLALLVVAGCSGNGPDEHVTGDVADAPDYVTMNEEAAANDGLVARVILPNQVVEWYEPTAGMLIMSEAGIASDDIASITSEPGLQDMMPTELYEFLSDKPAPQALRDIEANALGDLRLTAFTGIEPGELTTPSGAALAGGDLPTGQVAPGLRTSAITNASGTVTNSCEESWFRTKFCSSSGYDVTYCRPNLYNVEWWADIYDLEVGGAGACSKSGTISIKANFTCNIVDGLEGVWLSS